MIPELIVLLCGTCLVQVATDEPPPPAEAAPAAALPTMSPQPAAAAPVAPPLNVLEMSSSGFRPPEQADYGVVRVPSPAQNLAMMEAGRPLFASDPQVATMAVALTYLTAVFVEDAPRIAELTIRVVGDLRDANQNASPFEMLAGGAIWTGPAGRRGNVPRKFGEFAAGYRRLRLQGKDHDSAVSLLQPGASGPQFAP